MNRIYVAVPAMICTVAAIFMIANEAHAQVSRYTPKVGEPHADFILPSIDDGMPLQLSDYRGKKVVLMHFASW